MSVQKATPAKLSAGEYVVYNGKLYVISMVITLTDGTVMYAVKQNHWPQGFVLHVKHEDVVVDPPFTA